jgi:hypothetical protein
MNDYYQRPDGEYFADQVEKPIPTENSWHDLSMVQLIDVKTQLEGKLWAFRNNPQISTVLKRSVARITEMISSAARQ